MPPSTPALTLRATPPAQRTHIHYLPRYTYTADWQVDTGGAPHEVKEHTAENLIKQAAETQQHLGPYLDL